LLKLTMYRLHRLNKGLFGTVDTHKHYGPQPIPF
jgi:hypothetical protein